MKPSWTVPSNNRMAPGTYLVIILAGFAIGGMAALLWDTYKGDQRQKQWAVDNHCKVDHYVTTAFDVVPIFRCDTGLFKYRDMPR